MVIEIKSSCVPKELSGGEKAQHLRLDYNPLDYFGAGEDILPDQRQKWLQDIIDTVEKETKLPEGTVYSGKEGAGRWSRTINGLPAGYQLLPEGGLRIDYNLSPTGREFKKYLGADHPDASANGTLKFVTDAANNPAHTFMQKDWDQLKGLESSDSGQDDILPLSLKMMAAKGATQKLVATLLEFSPKTLHGEIQFSNLDFSGAEFDYCVFKNMDFSGCNVADAKFKNCVFINCTGVDMKGVETCTTTNCALVEKKSGDMPALFDIADKKLFAAQLDPEKKAIKNSDLSSRDLSNPPKIAEYVLKNAGSRWRIAKKLKGCIFDDTTKFHVDENTNKQIHAILKQYSTTVTLPTRESISARSNCWSVIEEATLSALYKTADIKVYDKIPEIGKGKFKLIMKPDDDSVYLVKKGWGANSNIQMVKASHSGEILENKVMTVAEILNELGMRAKEKTDKDSENSNRASDLNKPDASIDPKAPAVPDLSE